MSDVVPELGALGAAMRKKQRISANCIFFREIHWFKRPVKVNNCVGRIPDRK